MAHTYPYFAALELSRSVRETLFDSLTREGRQHPAPRFDAFVDAVVHALEEDLSGCRSPQS